MPSARNSITPSRPDFRSALASGPYGPGLQRESRAPACPLLSRSTRGAGATARSVPQEGVLVDGPLAGGPQSGHRRTGPQHLAGHAGQHLRQLARRRSAGRRRRCRPARRCPAPGYGPFSGARSATDSPMVAPTTTPNEPSGCGPGVASAQLVDHRLGHRPAVGQPGVLDLRRLLVRGQRDHEDPRVVPGGQLEGRVQRADPEVRADRDRIDAPETSPDRGRPRRRRPWSSRCRRV